jgi:1,4-dihydroxy-2-naphthoyl-CoA synthase
MAEAYQKEFFNVTFPAEYVAHVEINRPEKLNAFKEMYVQTPPSNSHLYSLITCRYARQGKEHPRM